MPRPQAVVAITVTAGLMMSAPVNAQEPNASSAIQAEPVLATPVASAKNIRNLNIMLMVTSLRCRGSAHDFSGEYELFAQAHQANIASAHRELVREMSATYGAANSERVLDRDGVSMANRFGEGHPTLGCSELKEATLELAMNQDRFQLASMADRLLNPNSDRSALRRRAAAPATAPGEAQSIEAAEPVAQVPNWLRG